MTDDEFVTRSSLISPRTGIIHTNRLRIRPYPDFLQVWLRSGMLGSASIRLQRDQIDDLITYLQTYRKANP